MKKINYKILFIYIILFSTFFSCTKEEDLKYEKVVVKQKTGVVDSYLKEHFLDKYNSAIIYEWDDRYVDIEYYVGPAKKDLVVPTAKFIEDFWIQPYAMCSEKGKTFIEKNFPNEVVLIGTKMLNENGTTTLGFAEAGVRITLTEVNDFNLKSDKWVRQQLHTMHHEFTHIVHQTYKLPEGYEKITGGKYTGNSWTTLEIYSRGMTDEQLENETDAEREIRHNAIEKKDNSNAIKRGVVTAYGTSNEYEDFAELVSNFLIIKADDFNEEYMPKSDSEIKKIVGDTIANFNAKAKRLMQAAYDKRFDQFIKDNKTNTKYKTKEELLAAANREGMKVAEATRINMPEVVEIIQPMVDEIVSREMATGKTKEEAEAVAVIEIGPYLGDMIFITTQRALKVSEFLKSLNDGKRLIKKKLDMTMDYYKSNFDVDLNKLRDIIQERIVNAKK
jgi:substrate import-associated zinc metallohydrolase lipoprotein